MKKMLLGLALVTAAMTPTTVSADNGKVQFKGNVQGLKDSLIVMSPGGDGYTKMDTVLVKDGKFEFVLSVKEPTIISGYSPATLREQENIGFQVIAVPGESAEITGDLTKNYYVTGSKFYQEFNETDKAIELISKPLKDFENGLNARMAAGESRAALVQEYQAKSPELQKQVIEGILKFIKDHPNYEACAAFIPTLENLDKMKEAVSYLAPAVRDGRMKAYYQSVIDRLEARAKAEAEAQKKQAVGVLAPDFTLDDINGKPLALSSLRGKYVVLDFWGSWCGWCIKGIPEMKNYYNKYKDKMEILGVDCNDTEEKWKAAVKKHELPWLHVYNPRGSKLLSAYGVQGFPTKIILGPDGKIVKTVVGEDPSFYTFLDEIFAK